MLFNRNFFETKTSTCIDAKTLAYIINCHRYCYKRNVLD
jgi:hypothetical protein